ncbi:MAG: hypothetical protein QW803_02340 [Candidatus Methanomethylicia archaeon]
MSISSPLKGVMKEIKTVTKSTIPRFQIFLNMLKTLKREKNLRKIVERIEKFFGYCYF